MGCINPEPCWAWSDLPLEYRMIYRPLIASLQLRMSGRCPMG